MKPSCTRSPGGGGRVACIGSVGCGASDRAFARRAWLLPSPTAEQDRGQRRARAVHAEASGDHGRGGRHLNCRPQGAGARRPCGPFAVRLELNARKHKHASLWTTGAPPSTHRHPLVNHRSFSTPPILPALPGRQHLFVGVGQVRPTDPAGEEGVTRRQARGRAPAAAAPACAPPDARERRALERVAFATRLGDNTNGPHGSMRTDPHVQPTSPTSPPSTAPRPQVMSQVREFYAAQQRCELPPDEEYMLDFQVGGPGGLGEFGVRGDVARAEGKGCWRGVSACTARRSR